MKKIFFFSFLATGFLLAGPICDFKAQQIQKQIDYATKYKHKHKISGLKQALKEVQDHCVDKDVVNKTKKEIQKLEAKISEMDTKIAELKTKDKPKKLKEAEMKKKLIETELENEKSDLEEMQKMLKTNPSSPKA